jgi:hypothetical protein
MARFREPLVADTGTVGGAGSIPAGAVRPWLNDRERRPFLLGRLARPEQLFHGGRAARR